VATELVSCPACGTKNAAYRFACLKCGVELFDPTGAELPTQEEVPTASDQTKPPLAPVSSHLTDQASREPRRGTYFARHWHGELSLPRIEGVSKGSSLLLTFRDLARYYLPHVPSPAD